MSFSNYFCVDYVLLLRYIYIYIYTHLRVVLNNIKIIQIYKIILNNLEVLFEHIICMFIIMDVPNLLFKTIEFSTFCFFPLKL